MNTALLVEVETYMKSYALQSIGLAAAAAVLLSGCGGKTDGASASGTPAPSSPPSVSASPAPSAAAPSPSLSPSPSPLPPATPQKAEAMFKMSSKTFRFSPVDSETSNKAVLLTFDDGPKEKEELTSMLDTLDKHGAKAIFFVNGYRVKQNPELLKLIDERGQTIGNHSWDHIDLHKKSKAEVQKQLGDVSDLVEELTGKRPLFFRPPFGTGGDVGKEVAKEDGMLYMTWSNGSLDWDLKATKKDPQLVIKNVLEQLHPGANILMHELPWTKEALDSLLTKLEEKGYGFIDPASIDLKQG
ncbi:Peptidoglycan/xylan/chitin deacetylase, PgdA/CDA1 family [Paenibacillus sp. RU4T]|nr:Peptidoglycan/xylan/chitin deacetylase, PgdA/CDA1 family [Paenibacillus sp. RU4X]SIQ70426.1 Peptidoglycan/xylan/chitin deacetylase, PgdA/CDA1 family [Paenibacillus sp. RU4T]